MEKYLILAKSKAATLNLERPGDLRRALSSIEPIRSIDVKDLGEMKVCKIKGDGNCQFRTLGFLMTGEDGDENHKKLRKLAVKEFKKLEETVVERTGFFSHHKDDCLRRRSCKQGHPGAYIVASKAPCKRLVNDRSEFVKEMSKEYVWGNEMTMHALSRAMGVKVNFIQYDQKGKVYKSTQVISPECDLEVNVLYSPNQGHYEALIPSIWKLTEKNSSQSAKADSEGVSFKRKYPQEDSKNGSKLKMNKMDTDFLKYISKMRSKQNSDLGQDFENNKAPSDGQNDMAEDKDGSNSENDFVCEQNKEMNEDQDEYIDVKESSRDSTDSSDNEPEIETGDKALKSSSDDKSDEDAVNSGNEECEKNSFHIPSKNMDKEKTVQPKMAEMFQKVSQKSRNEKVVTEKKRDEKTNEGTKQPLKEMKKRSSTVQIEWFSNKCELKDSNGDFINLYLRRFPGSKVFVSCEICNQKFSVKYKGFSAILRHSESRKHKEFLAERRKEPLGIYCEKSCSNESVRAEIAIARFAAAHNISFKKTVPHLMKTIKMCFPDSPICQNMGDLSASRLRYGLTNGLAKTELDSTKSDLNATPFSMQLDGGTKGRKHRENFLVRYYDENLEKVVDKFILTKTIAKENSKVVADTFIDWSEKENIDIAKNLIMVNSDHAATLRGIKTGAVVRISEKAPNLKSTDVGGDILHDINNATKKSFYANFKDIVKILDITRSDLRSSAGKMEDFLLKCGKHGFNQNQPKLWCRSRFLSRLECVKERRERLPAYVDHFETVEPARRKKNEKPSGKNSFQKANDSDESDSESSDDEGGRKPKSARIDWIKNIFREDLARVAVALDLSVECLEPSHTLLKVFQSQAPMIHTLKPTILEFTRDTFLNITSYRNLKYSDGRPLGGKGLKEIKFETEEERKKRKEDDKELDKKLKGLREEVENIKNHDNPGDMRLILERQKRMTMLKREIKKAEEEKSDGRFALLLEPKDMTLGKAVRETISSMAVSKQMAKDLEKEAKKKKFDYYRSFSSHLQKHLPLENHLLSHLVFVDPHNIDNKKTEKAFRGICDKMPMLISEDEQDEVIKELRHLQMNLKNFGKDFEKYRELREQNDDLFKNLPRIDTIWTPVIKGSHQKINPVKLGTLSQQGGWVAEDQTRIPNCI